MAVPIHEPESKQENQSHGLKTSGGNENSKEGRKEGEVMFQFVSGDLQCRLVLLVGKVRFGGQLNYSLADPKPPGGKNQV